MKKTPLRILAVTQSLVLVVLMFLTLGNEIIDIPQYVFDDVPTLYSQRIGEMSIELSIFIAVAIIQVIVFRKLYTRIRVLEGFLLICANCKKIKNHDEEWEQIEHYVTERSHARFSHGICPDCAKKHYGEYFTEED